MLLDNLNITMMKDYMPIIIACGISFCMSKTIASVNGSSPTTINNILYMANKGPNACNINEVETTCCVVEMDIKVFEIR